MNSIIHKIPPVRLRPQACVVRVVARGQSARAPIYAKAKRDSDPSPRALYQEVYLYYPPT
jgi:hypothetical protein